MFPWLWIFAPAIRFPWSGAVAQDFTLDAFFRGIRPGGCYFGWAIRPGYDGRRVAARVPAP